MKTPPIKETKVFRFMQVLDLDHATETSAPTLEPTFLKAKGVVEPSEQIRTLREQFEKELERIGKEHFGALRKKVEHEEKEKGKDPPLRTTANLVTNNHHPLTPKHLAAGLHRHHPHQKGARAVVM